MLTNCPECELQVSDKALSCPHCGYPITKTQSVKRKYNTRKKRLPNGFGQISYINNQNLRNKYRVKVPVGKTPEGKYLSKPLKPKAYFATYNEAYAALVEYNKNPYDLDDCITVQELYDRWTDSYFKSLKSDSSIRTITCAWNYCSSVYNMRVTDIRARHIKGCMEDGQAVIRGKLTSPSAGVKSRIKSMFNLMLDYALEYELVERNYARTFAISEDIIQEKNKNYKGHMPFTEEEINILWANVANINYVDVILIQCYSGWRPQELGLIRIEDVDLENNVFYGGIKTDAGTNRAVPIHPRILELVKARYNEAIELDSDYLINCTDAYNSCSSIKFTYDKYQKRFNKIRDQLHLNQQHRAHDGRMHFITMAKKYNVDEYAIKYIVGHQIQDITERVYTKRELEWLTSEIQKIK